jgi:hypothetical protein
MPTAHAPSPFATRKAASRLSSLRMKASMGTMIVTEGYVADLTPEPDQEPQAARPVPQ